MKIADINSFVLSGHDVPGKSLLSSLRADARGGTAILVALAIPVVIGALGVGVDTGMWYLEKRKLQQASDAASLGAVRAMQNGASTGTAQAVAVNDARRNGYVTGSDTTVTVNAPPTSGT